MMKSKGSCFKIITCARDTEDDLEPSESKSLTDKSRWNFRKRSARHRVLSNSTNTESPSIGNRDSLESTSIINYNAQSNLTTPDKLSVSHWASDYPLTGEAANPNAPFIDTKKDFKTEPVISTEHARAIDPSIFKQDVNKVDRDLEEVSAVVIQSAIRGYLAKRKLLKQKNVIKLQAAVRGHLVRSQAVGTLCCVQAISKMQVLVRARLARHQASGIEAKPDGHEIYSNVQPMAKENSDSSSTEKLLSNAFARQIMQSTPNKKQIHIKCDPLKQDSAWQWLVRWMSVSSSDPEPNKQQFTTVDQKQDENVIDTTSEVGNEISAEVISASKDMKSTTTNAGTSLDNEDNLITYEADNFVFQASRPTSTSTNNMQPPCVDDLGVNDARAFSSKSNTRESELLSTAPSQTARRTVSDKPMADSEQPKRSMKRVASEQPETENKKTVFGSRKATNPAFVAVQSKFEGLSSRTTSRKSISSTTQDVGAESKLNSLSSSADSWKKTQEPNLAESSISREVKVQVAPSECGSLLSLTSTLDSPERYEVGGVDVKQGTTFVEKVTSELNMAADTASSSGNLDVEPKTDIRASQPISSIPASFQPSSGEDGKRVSLNLDLAVEQQKEEMQPDRSASDAQSQIDVVAYQQAYRSSPEGSPGSHVTIPESYGTPSSQVSVNAKRSKWDKSVPTQTRKHHAAVKRSPSNQNHESGGKSSTEQLSKDAKNGKRRSSFGSSKSSNHDQEPRDSSSSTLPSYMQVTESRRAKVLVSPRSNPDVQDKEIYIKKRHSLPVTNGKQGSPRMQRSMSQALQGGKGKWCQFSSW